MKMHWPNWMKFLVLVYFIVLFRTRYKELDVILVQCPFNQENIFFHERKLIINEENKLFYERKLIKSCFTNSIHH